ncbi:MAG TPA: hypothetical protein VGB18_04570, partial [Candidatus Thermoplasmatota archaeon]
MLSDWVSAGVPTFVVGREAAAPIRALIPSSCHTNEALPLGHSVLPDTDDQLDLGDVVRLDAQTSAYAALERNGQSHVLAYRCPGTSIAFAGIKPWAPDSGWVLTHPTDVTCLKLLTAPLVPHLAGGTVPTSCEMSERWIEDASFPSAFRATPVNGSSLAE